ncbi:MAG: ABC transporter substrate-binding protein [Cyanothece sp. SIO1E1]|nr:ABC transporter substrate-binding protein [Cyanothece sp. SIO1E1]
MQATRRHFLQAAAGFTGTALGITACQPQAQISGLSSAQLSRLTIGGSPILITILMAYLAQESALVQQVKTIDFKIWKTQDQLRADVVSGKLQVSATPTHVAANLYQRGVPITLLNVLVWGALHMMAREPVIAQWDDLAGRTLLVPFRGGVPDQLLRYLTTASGLQPDQDFTIQYTTDFAEAVQLLLAGRGDVAVLSEPAATGAQLRGAQQGVEIQRSLNLSAEWGRITGRAPRIPQAGTLALRSLTETAPNTLEIIQTGLAAAVNWVNQNPAAAAELGAQSLELNPIIVEQAISHTQFEFVSAADARADLEFWFAQLINQNPKLMGGQLPNADFYHGIST